MFLFILDSNDNEIMAKPVVHKKKYEKKQGKYHHNIIFRVLTIHL